MDIITTKSFVQRVEVNLKYVALICGVITTANAADSSRVSRNPACVDVFIIFYKNIFVLKELTDDNIR